MSLNCTLCLSILGLSVALGAPLLRQDAETHLLIAHVRSTATDDSLRANRQKRPPAVVIVHIVDSTMSSPAVHALLLALRREGVTTLIERAPRVPGWDTLFVLLAGPVTDSTTRTDDSLPSWPGTCTVARPPLTTTVTRVLSPPEISAAESDVSPSWISPAAGQG